MRTTLTIDDDVASLLEKENHRAREPMKQTVHRMLRAGLTHSQRSQEPKRFIVQPIDRGITPEQ